MPLSRTKLSFAVAPEIRKGQTSCISGARRYQQAGTRLSSFEPDFLQPTCLCRCSNKHASTLVLTSHDHKSSSSRPGGVLHSLREQEQAARSTAERRQAGGQGQTRIVINWRRALHFSLSICRQTIVEILESHKLYHPQARCRSSFLPGYTLYRDSPTLTTPSAPTPSSLKPWIASSRAIGSA